MKFPQINSANVVISTKRWIKSYSSPTATIWQPRYSIGKKKIDCESSSIDPPYIRVQKSEGRILNIEIRSGIIREVPIYYCIHDDMLTISDSPKTFERLNSMFDDLSLKEFLVYGYVTTNRTLLKDVFCLTAGQRLMFENSTLSIENEYLYNTATVFDEDIPTLREELLSTAESIFNQLIKDLEGRTVILPLSAGYDSRFIAAMLKLGGYEKVKCFSWGEEKHPDVGISREIAATLGYNWTHIDYNQSSWKETIMSDWLPELLCESSGYVSTSGIASLPFLNYLMRTELDHADCVVLPGHTGDFISGGHIPLDLEKNSSIKGVVQSILSRHSLIGTDLLDATIVDDLTNQISELASLSLSRIYETWEWRERQSKFIVNTNRYYESLELSWNMPLWHEEFVQFWDKMPLSLKKSSLFYNQVLESSVFSPLNLDIHLKPKQSPNTSKLVLKKLIRSNKLLLNMARKMVKRKPSSDEYGFYYALEELERCFEGNSPSTHSHVENEFSKLGSIHNPKAYSHLSKSILTLIIDDLSQSAR